MLVLLFIRILLQFSYLLTTQFESVGARRAFPCFDEPEFKAKYTISVVLDEKYYNDKYRVLSNTKLVKDSPTQDNET